MSRKDWSEDYRDQEVINRYEKIEKLEREIEHLTSPDWRKPFPKEIKND